MANDPKKVVPKAEEKTHVVVRSRKGVFRRAGLKFGPEFAVFSLADLGDKVAAIEVEPMLEARRVTAEDATRYTLGSVVADDEAVTKAELRQALAESHARIEQLERELRETRLKLSGADLPPPPGKLPDGSPILR